MNFHIGEEMVQSLMKKENSAETQREDLQVRARARNGTPGSRGSRDLWSLDTLASVLFLALRWIL